MVSNQEITTERNMKRSLSESVVSDVISKKFRDDRDDDDTNKDSSIPAYLQLDNQCFQFIITKYINSTIPVKDLQLLTILKHRMAAIQHEKVLWQFYMQLGTGQFETILANKINSKDRCFWSSNIRTKALPYVQAMNSEDEQRLYELFVHNYLQELDQSLTNYQDDYSRLKSKFANSLSMEMEHIFDAFVQYFGIQSLESDFNYEMTSLQYEYELYLLDCKYQQYIPTEYEQKIAHRLSIIQYEYVQAKMDLFEYKQGVFHNKPPKSLVSTGNKLKINDLMVQSINELEQQVYRNWKLLDNELHQTSLRNPLADIIFQKFKVIQKKIQSITNQRIISIIKKQEESVSFSPTVIIQTASSHQFTQQQFKLLNRGPSFIPQCQLLASSIGSTVLFRDKIEKQYKTLQHNLNILLAKYNINTTRSMFIIKTIKDLYMKTFHIEIPQQIQERAIYEKQLLQTIHKDLQVNELIIRRTANPNNQFYVTDRKQFETLANNYLSNADQFELVLVTSSQSFSIHFKQMIKSINMEIERILSNKKLYKELLDKLILNEHKVQIPYLYFLPDINQSNTMTLKPIIVAQNSVTFWLGQFLNDLYEPLLQRQSISTTFKNGTDFIQKLNHYANVRKSLRQHTFFIKLTITNFDRITTHTVMLHVLERFLRDHLAIPSIGNLSIQKLLDLTALFLNHNQFFYNNQIYRCTKGVPSSLSLANTLSQIYIYQWQNILLDRTSLLNNELFGRCKNYLLLTWNQTTSEYHKVFDNLSAKDTNIQFKMEVGFQIQFLNITIENRKGTLYTNVFHEKTIQKYTLPYVIGGHTQIVHDHWLQSALIRAVRYCTSMDDFNLERIYLEVTCLANGYSLEFIEHRINHFYSYFNVKSLRLTLNQEIYDKLRDRLFNFIRAQRHYELENNELVKKKRYVELTYLYEYGSTQVFDKELTKIVSDYLNSNLHLSSSSHNEQIKIILRKQQQFSLNALLSEQKPRNNFLNIN